MCGNSCGSKHAINIRVRGIPGEHYRGNGRQGMKSYVYLIAEVEDGNISFSYRGRGMHVSLNF